MNVILFYQHIGRELFSIKKLSDILISNKNIVFVYSIDFELDVAIKTARNINIDIVVSPWMYHDRNYEEFVPFIKLNPKVKIINLHSEQIYAPFSRIAVMPAKGAASDYVYHFCWSERFKDDLIKDGVNEKLCYVTGNMRTDEAISVKLTRKELANRYNLDENKSWILFAENRNFIKSTQSNNSSFRQKGVDEESISNRIKYYRETLEGTIKDLNALSDSFFSRYELIYRAHPGFQGNMGITNKNIKEICELSIYEWLHASDVCVVWNSTVAFESEIMQTPVVVCSPCPVEKLYQTIGLDTYPYIKSINEICTMDLGKIQKEQIEKKNYELYLGKVEGKASANVANSIKAVFKANDDYHARIIPVKRFYHIKKWLSIKVLKLLIYANVFELLKFPRSAYQQKNDIPYYTKNKTGR